MTLAPPPPSAGAASRALACIAAHAGGAFGRIGSATSGSSRRAGPSPKQAVVPPAVVRWHPPGGNAPAPLFAGDLVLVQHRSGSALELLPATAIRVGGWMRPDTRPYSWVHHAMIVDGDGASHEAAADAFVIQETPAGSVRTPLEAFREALYAVVQPDVDPTWRLAAVAFARWTLGSSYNWTSIVADTFDDLTGLRIAIASTAEMVCSSAACRAHERLGLIPDKEPAAVQPADLARFYGVSSTAARRALQRARPPRSGGSGDEIPVR